MDFSEMCDKVMHFIRKFFSIVVALTMSLLTLLYIIGAGRVVTIDRSFGHAGFAHFLAILSAIVTALGYVALHFVPRKAYRLLYALTFMFILSIFLVSHSIGLSAPVVTDCNRFGMLKNLKSISNITDFGHMTNVTDQNVIIGSLGERVHICIENALMFATGFINVVLYVVGIFDVQSVLLSRVKSKTYGERFVEMGISG